MGYVEQTLAPSERIIERANFNWTCSVGPVLWLILGALPLLYTASLHGMRGEAPGDQNVIYSLAAIPFVAGIIIVISHVIMLQTTEIVVTTSRFVYKTGLLTRTTKEVSLNMIEEINLQQSFLGRIFDYGNITLRGTGVGMIRLPDIDSPVILRRTIETAKDALVERRVPIEPTAPGPTGNAVPASSLR